MMMVNLIRKMEAVFRYNLVELDYFAWYDCDGQVAVDSYQRFMS